MKSEFRSQNSGVRFQEPGVGSQVRRVWVIIPALLLAAAAFWTTRQVVSARSSLRPPLGVLGEVKHLKVQLGLSDTQVQEIRKLEQDLSGRLSEQCGRYCLVRARLGESLMSNDTASAATSKELVESLCAMQAASEMTTLEHIRKVCEVLNPEQRQLFLSDLTKCLCNGEGLCAGSCMKDERP